MMMHRMLGLVLAVPLVTAVAPPGAADDPVTAAKAEIWAKERGIYADRGRGSLDFYVNNASNQYLGWPPTSKDPFPLSRLRSANAAMNGQAHEKIDTIFKGFTLSGSTAVIYYLNHRTMLPDGTRVDQEFENIHVWAKEDGQWKVLGGMSRQVSAR